MGKKNLEQLFKERLGNFQEVPDDKVWQSIEISLDKKKQKRRVVPIWWRLGGAAAVLAILLYVINPFGGKNNEGQITVTETESAETPNQNNVGDDVLESTNQDEEKLVDGQDNSNSEAVESTVVDVQKGSDRSVRENQSQYSNEQVTLADSQQKTSSKSKDEATLNAQNNVQNSSIAVADSGNQNEPVSEKEIQKDVVQNQDLLESAVQKDAVVENALDKQQPQENSAVDPLEGQTEGEDVIVQNEAAADDGKQSIFDAIAAQEEEVVVNSSSKKWSVGPSVAPVYFSASGEGSPVHSTFASNSKSGNVDLSYGLTVAYEIGKKLKIRSGVHRVNYGYDTNDVVFTSSLDGSINLIDNIDYSNASQNIVLESRDKGSLSLDKAEVGSASAVLDGKMVQQLGYIEVPLELNYSLIDKKFGVDIIGGVSSLFLTDNSVMLKSEGLVTEVGEANNANSVNFSTNVGVGFNYEFTPKVQLNVEPVFKYQLNTFSDTSGSFRPFSVGVYSGVRFKF